MQTIYVELDIPRVLVTRVLGQVWAGAYLSSISPLHFVTQPDPPLPGPHSVRVENRLSLMCGTDLHLAYIDGDPRVSPGVLPGNTRTYLGHELSGRVTEVGSAVTQLHPGDRVTLRYPAQTCHTQGIEPPCPHCARGDYCLCENQSLGRGTPILGGGWGDQFIAHEQQLYRPPADLSDDAVALIEPAAVGVHSVLQALPQAGERVLVLGCGIIGLMTIQALHALAPEAQITALARYPFQAEMAQRMGAQDVRVREDGYAVTAAITGAKVYKGMMGSTMLLGGFDTVFDCVGTSKTLTDTLRWARAGGTVVLVGIQFKPLTVDLTPVWYQEVRLVGAMSHGTETWEGERIGTFELTARLFQEGKFTADGLITHRFPLAQWREAIATAASKRAHQAIKVAFAFPSQGK